jgi:glycosyltransferase involved in cell wall biosynthesis
VRLGVDARVLVRPRTGVARYLSEILECWKELRQSEDELTLYVDRRVPERLPGEPSTVRVLRWPFPGGDPVWRQLRLGLHVRSNPPDVLFCPFYSIPLACRAPTVVTIHDVSFVAHPEWFERRARLAFRLVAPSARRASAVVTVSRYSAAEISSRLGIDESGIEVIPPGVGERWFAPCDPEVRGAVRRWLGFEEPFLLHLGAVQLRRRPELLVRGFAGLVRRHPELKLVVAGPTTGPSVDVMSLAREGGVAGSVRRREWVPEELVRPLLSQAAALVYLSTYEGFGLPALEALAVGTPVVALRCASLPEVLGNVAVWIDEESPAAVECALDALLSNEARAADLAAAGRKRARRFSPLESARATFALLRRQVGR